MKALLLAAITVLMFSFGAVSANAAPGSFPGDNRSTVQEDGATSCTPRPMNTEQAPS